jgi:hypothetical protein
MPVTPAAPQAPRADEPKHPLHALTTYELRDYRRELEQAIAFFDRQAPVPPASAQLRARLDAVLAEQDERARLARA